jgi:hypothetical protein
VKILLPAFFRGSNADERKGEKLFVMVGLRIQIKYINTSQILDSPNPSKLSPEAVLYEFLMSFEHDFQIS